MRMFVKFAPLSMLALLIACGGASPDAAEGAAPGVGPEQPAAATGDQGDEAAKINALVASAGHMNTDKKADAAPVATSPTTQQLLTATDGTPMQCKFTDYSLTKVPEKFVALNPNADVLWPGSLVQGKSMAGGILDPIPVKRAPGTITLTLASGGGGPFFKKMDEPSLSAAIQAQNEILASYTGATPAKFSYSFQSVYSSEQLAVAVEADVQGTNWSASGALSFNQSDAKSHVLIQFSQEYYTMAFDPPQGAAGVFDKSVTANDLAPYAQAGNPPVYVSGVTYGRIFYILFESSDSQTSLDAAVKGSYSGGVNASASASADWKKTINNSTVKAYGLGGNAEMAINAVIAPSQFDRIASFLTTGANFDKNNPGVPISYTIRHLTDASQVKLALTTEYTAKDCTPEVKGCDGVFGSGKVVDKCGVCGGDGTTCDSCPAQIITNKQSNGAYVDFHVGAASHGSVIPFADGSYYKWDGYCRRVMWGNVKLQCNDGSWQYVSGSSVSHDINCFSDSNASWSDGSGDSISTGYAP